MEGIEKGKEKNVERQNWKELERSRLLSEVKKEKGKRKER